jgi:predicted dehydrogenase
MQALFNVGVVGCGYWGPNLIRNFNALPDCKVKQVCDADPKRLAHMKELHPAVQTTQDINDLLADPEIRAIAVATPVHFHYEIARKCLEAGKHTFVEKPMASCVAECTHLVELAEQRKLILMVGHTFLYSSPVRRIKEIVDSGELGNLLYISSRRLNLGLFQRDINVAWDLAPHDISIVLYILNAAPVSVSCQGKAHITEGIEDVTNLTLNFSNGVFAMIQSSWLDPSKVRETTFVGTKKMLVYNDIEPTEKIKIYDKRVEAPPYYDTFAEFQYSYHYGDMYAPYIKQVEPLRVECQHFIECIREDKKPVSNGRNGLDVVTVLEAANQSLRNNGATVSL